jgi:TATA-binding protein-associated factor Taf7
LFAKVWPKQLKSAVVEANESLDHNARFKPPAPDAISQVLVAAEKVKPSREVESNKQTQLIDRETKENYLSQTRDKPSGYLIHENLLLKF